MSEKLFLKMQAAEARGHIPEGTALAATDAVIAEMGARALLKGYYGDQTIQAVLKELREDQYQDSALEIAEHLKDGLAPLLRALRYSDQLATTDFPTLYQTLVTRVRPVYATAPSNWREFATVTTASDFREIRSLKINELPELKNMAELEDIQYANFSESETGYRVAKKARAIPYSWEMWKNDELGRFTRALESLGQGAIRTEAIVVFKAIFDGLVRETDASMAGAPTIDKLKAIRANFAARTYTDSDGQAVEIGLDITDIIFGTGNRDAINQILTAETEPGTGNQKGNAPNVLRGAFTPHLERLWGRVFGTDYVVFDNLNEWLEVAFLEGFQNGPRVTTKMPTIVEYQEMGSFENHSLAVGLVHVIGAKVIDPLFAKRVQGA